MGEQLSTNPTPDSNKNSTSIITSSTGSIASTHPTVKLETVPLATFLELKNSLKDAKSKLAEIEDSKYNEELKAKKTRVRDKWIDKGFDELTAEAISDEIAGIYEELGKAKKTQADILLSEQMDELSNDSFFADIKQYESQIKAKVKQFAKAGEKISLEDAYLIVTGPKTKLRESRIKQEVSGSLGDNGTQTNVPTASGSKPQNIYNLDTNDKKALSELKKFQPSFGWDEKKYFETMIKDRR